MKIWLIKKVLEILYNILHQVWQLVPIEYVGFMLGDLFGSYQNIKII
jgi:hypothetical protein